MRSRLMLLTLLVVAALALVGCGASGQSDEAELPTPNAGTPVFESTPDVAGPVQNSPSEQTSPVPQEGDVDALGNPLPETTAEAGSDDTMEGMSTGGLYNVAIPLPENSIAGIIETDDQGTQTASYETPVSGAEVVAFFESELAAAGFQVERVEGGTDQNTVLNIRGNGVEGTISIVDEDTADVTRFKIAARDTQQ